MRVKSASNLVIGRCRVEAQKASSDEAGSLAGSGANEGASGPARGEPSRGRLQRGERDRHQSAQFVGPLDKSLVTAH